MKNIFLKSINLCYKFVIRRILFLMDPEIVHDRAINLGEFFGKYPLSKKILHWIFVYENKALEQEILGVKFKNPIGLAAGFDKDAHLTQIIDAIGFGFEEIGSVTGEPCEGNPRPRLWRLPKSKSIVVHYGLKNDGAEIISKRLSELIHQPVDSVPLAVSIAKTNSVKCADVQEGINDYAKAFKCFLNIGDFFIINISCPNAFGGEPFTDPVKLDLLLSELKKVSLPSKNMNTCHPELVSGSKNLNGQERFRIKSGMTAWPKPIFLKLAPNLSLNQIDKLIEISQKHRVNGFIISNLTKDKNLFRGDTKELEKVYQNKGSFSGKPVENLSNKLIEYVYKKTHGEFIIIGCGGIFSAEDAYKKIRLGASLVQLITGMIFEGPQLISQINRRLVKLLKKDGYKNISEAIGKDVKIDIP